MAKTRLFSLDAAGQVVLLLFGGWQLFTSLRSTIDFYANSEMNLLTAIVLSSRLLVIFSVVLMMGLTISRTVPKIESSSWVTRIAALMGTYFPVLMIVIPNGDGPLPIRIAGLVLSAVGIGGAIFCLAHLGRSFSIDAQARVLRTSGPYGIVRHPLYLCEFVALLGVMTTKWTLAAVAVAYASAVFQFWRMRNEEKVLTTAFPEYTSYRASTPMIIPFLRPKLLSAVAVAS